jgi:hypothetical protein
MKKRLRYSSTRRCRQAVRPQEGQDRGGSSKATVFGPTPPMKKNTTGMIAHPRRLDKKRAGLYKKGGIRKEDVMKDKILLRSLGLVLLVLFFFACIPVPVGGPAGPYEPGYTGRWVRLGTREVNWGVDRDSIIVSRARGPMRQLMVQARTSPVEIYDIRVIFTNGTSYDAARRQRLNTGGDRLYIDLPGTTRNVREVIFHYRKIGASSRRARIDLYGR